MSIVDNFLQQIKKHEQGILIVLFIVCALTRLLYLGERPVMHDESLFAYYTEFQFHREFIYNYMPILHGSLLLYLQAIVFFLFGASDYTMRLIPALSGLGCFIIIAQLKPWLGTYGRLVSLLFLTFSAPLMFYQRFMRSDPLLIFLTLWAVLSMLNLARHKSRSSLVQLLLAFTLMICTMESWLFFWFGVVTFGILVLLHDCLQLPVIKHRKAPLQFTPAKILGLCGTILSLFLLLVVLQTQVFEGITYEADVVNELGSNTSLSEMNSLKALSEGNIKWVVYYLFLFMCVSAAVSTVYYLAERKVGSRAIIGNSVEFLSQNILLILITSACCFFLYWALFTTFFVYPKNPFHLYRDTFSYWMGQNAIHRIHGPFHYHFAHLLLYELPLVVIAAGVLVASLWSKVPRTGVSIPTALLVVFFVIMNVVCLILPNVFSWLFVLPILFCAGFILLMIFGFKNPWVVRAFLFGLGAWFVLFLLSPEWIKTFQVPIKTSDPRILNYHDFLDETISVTNSYHLLLIILPTIAVLYHVWCCLEQKRRFEAFAFWWMLTMFGASSYAREKVPWVGIYTIVPLLLIAGIYAERFLNSGHKYLKVIALGCVTIGVLLGLKNSALLNVRYFADVRERMVYGHTPVDLRNHVRLVIDLAKQGSPNFSHSLYEHYPSVEKQTWIVDYNKPSLNRMTKVYVGNEELNWPLYWYFRDLEMTIYESPESAIQKKIPFLFLTPEQGENLAGLEENYHVMRGRSRMHWTPLPPNEKALWGIWRFGIPGYKRTLDTPAGEKLEETKREWKGLLEYWWSRKVMENPTPRFSVVEYLFAIHKDALSYQRSEENEEEVFLNPEDGTFTPFDRNLEGRTPLDEQTPTVEGTPRGERFLDPDRAIEEIEELEKDIYRSEEELIQQQGELVPGSEGQGVLEVAPENKSEAVIAPESVKE